MTNSVVLTRHEVAFEPASMADPHGRVFRHGGKLYRAIYPNIAQTYRDLLNNPKCTRLFDLGLIDTEIADLELEDTGLVLRHRELPHVTYGFEWCAPMLLDAARLTIDLAIELDSMGFELLDAHPWNVLFEGSTPRFIDFGSIVPAKSGTSWRGQPEFIKTFINPLFLLVRGYAEPARRRMADFNRWGVTDRELAGVVGRKQRLARYWQGLTMLPGANQPRASALIKFRDYLDRVELPEPTTEWSDYYNDYVSLDDRSAWTGKQTVADEVLRRVQPQTVLDLAANAGWFSMLAAQHGCKVVATDNDETCLANLYRQAKDQRLDILTVSQDFARPSPTHGPNEVFPDAFSRLNADLVMALAITHHLVFKAGMNFSQIAKTLDGFTQKTLLVEFIPREDRHVALWYTDQYQWYNLDNFKAALAPYFNRITEHPSNREPRVLLCCERSASAAAAA